VSSDAAAQPRRSTQVPTPLYGGADAAAAAAGAAV